VRAAAYDLVGETEQLGRAEQVVRERGDNRPGAVGVKVTRGEMRECLVFEVADDQFDDGVLAAPTPRHCRLFRGK
jgi:hypothetical protein